jgi:hypothetical protein
MAKQALMSLARINQALHAAFEELPDHDRTARASKLRQGVEKRIKLTDAYRGELAVVRR